MYNFPALKELIDFHKVDYQRVEARISKKELDFTYIITNGTAYIYSTGGELIKSILI